MTDEWSCWQTIKEKLGSVVSPVIQAIHATLHYKVNQLPHWACKHYSHSRETLGCLGDKSCQLCLQNTFRSAKWYRQGAVGCWVHYVCEVLWDGWLCTKMATISILANTVRPSVDRRYRLWGGNILMARPSTFLESRFCWGHDCGKKSKEKVKRLL